MCTVTQKVFNLNVPRILKTGFSNVKIKKSHTCEEGGAHLRNFVWYLLLNLKKLLKGTNKKCQNFNIYNVAFFKKIQRKAPGDIIILYLCTKNLDDMIK